ncbi:MAG: hypothetical protein ABW195_02800 [Ilumatobacteraceae bacterium]
MELGPEARRRRAQVHQLVVAAEERIPLRLKRDGWSERGREDLGQLLVATRGWTAEAADWAVTTWAAALGLTDERPAFPAPGERPDEQRLAAPPVVPADPPARPARPPTPDVASTDLPSELVGGPTALPSHLGPVATELPSDLVVTPTELPGESSARSSSRSPVLDDGAARDRPAAGSSAPDDRADASLPDASRALTAKAAAFLGRPLDAAYEVKAGPSPILMPIMALPIWLAPLALPVLSGVVGLVFIAVVAVGLAMWPTRILAVSGDEVWSLQARSFPPRPTALLAEGRRHDVVFLGGRLLPSVRFGGERLRFQAKRSAARKIPGTRRDGEAPR